MTVRCGFDSDVPGGGQPARSGLVVTNGGVFVDAGGPFFAIGMSWFTAQIARRDEPARYGKNARFLADHQVDYARLIGALGPTHYADRTIDPTAARWTEDVAAATDENYDTHGFRTHWTIFGGIELTPTPDARRQVVQRFIDTIARRAEKVLCVEIANEGWQNGFDGFTGRQELRELAAMVRAGLPHPVALTAPRDAAIRRDTLYDVVPTDGRQWLDPTTGETFAEDDPLIVAHASWLYEDSPATLGTVHPDRSAAGEGGENRHARQTWDVQFYARFPRTWITSEPKGPQSSGEADDHPLRLTMARVITQLSGGAGYTLHTGAGVRFGGVEDRARGRAANFWEVANIEATLGGLQAMRAALPPLLANYRRHNTDPGKFPGHPFAGPALLAAHNDKSFLRAFAATSDEGFVWSVLAVQRTFAVPAARACHIRLLHPVTGAVLRSTDVAVGQLVTIPPDPESVVVVGEWR